MEDFQHLLDQGMYHETGRFGVWVYSVGAKKLSWLGHIPLKGLICFLA